MRISELSRRAGVPTSTIKFYIRDGLLPPGERSGPNQASYGEDHLQRLALIKALREVADLSLEVVREVLEQVDLPWEGADPIGRAVEVLYPAPERDRTREEARHYERTRAEVDALMNALPWVYRDSPQDVSHYLNVEQITDAVLQLRKHVEPDFTVERLHGCAQAAWLFSEAFFGAFEDRVPQPGDDLVDPTRAAILGFLMVDPLVSSFVRTALVMRSMRISHDAPLPGPYLEKA